MIIKIFRRIRGVKPEVSVLAAAAFDLRMTLQITGQTIRHDLPLGNKFRTRRKKSRDLGA